VRADDGDVASDGDGSCDAGHGEIGDGVETSHDHEYDHGDDDDTLLQLQ
jgi:hypothetical protein